MDSISYVICAIVFRKQKEGSYAWGGTSGREAGTGMQVAAPLQGHIISHHVAMVPQFGGFNFAVPCDVLLSCEMSFPPPVCTRDI